MNKKQTDAYLRKLDAALAKALVPLEGTTLDEACIERIAVDVAKIINDVLPPAIPPIRIVMTKWEPSKNEMSFAVVPAVCRTTLVLHPKKAKK